MTRVDHRDERELERLGRVAARLFFENCQQVVVVVVVVIVAVVD